MTYRERRETRAERLRGWADTRTERATATLDADRARYGGDIAFNTQPGHIPERARVIARTDRAIESLNKAASMESRADGIDAQLARSIYDDDPDAESALLIRISDLEAQRQRIKAYNASCRKGQRDLSLLSERERDDLATTARVAPYQIGKHGEMPSYVLTNLSGNISRQRERLARLIRQGAA